MPTSPLGSLCPETSWHGIPWLGQGLWGASNRHSRFLQGRISVSFRLPFNSVKNNQPHLQPILELRCSRGTILTNEMAVEVIGLMRAGSTGGDSAFCSWSSYPPPGLWG